MKTFMSVVRWLYLIYLPVMFVLLGVILYQINVIHYNPLHINEDFGAQVLLAYMMFMCAFAAILFYNNEYNRRCEKGGQHG